MLPERFRRHADELSIVDAPGATPRRLALCGDHGAPVVWRV